jgi:hypothetical protein
MMDAAEVDRLALSFLKVPQPTNKKTTEAINYKYCLALWNELTGEYGQTWEHPRTWWGLSTPQRRARQYKMEFRAKLALLKRHPGRRPFLPDAQPYFQWKAALQKWALQRSGSGATPP